MRTGLKEILWLVMAMMLIARSASATDAPRTLAEYHEYIRAWLPPEIFDAALARYPAATDDEARAAR